MVADRINDVEDVNLDAMSTDELLSERSAVKVEIARIDAQLKNQPGRPSTPEDESPDWQAFRAWRRRARWALVHKRQELESIRQLLRDRHTLAIHAAQQRRAGGQVMTPALSDALWVNRGEQIKAALATQSDAGLLLRAHRVIRHLLADYLNRFPDSLDEADLDTVVMLGLKMRQLYGTGRVKQFVNSTDGAVE